MGNIESAGDILSRSIAAMGEDFQKKLRRQAVFNFWREIIGEVYYKQVTPIRISHKILTLYTNNSVLGDQLKYLSGDIIAAIKNKIGEGVVEKIEFAKTFEKPSEDLKNIIYGERKNYFPKNPAEIVGDLNRIVLTEQEFKKCKKFSEQVKNPERKKLVLDTFVGLKKLEKLKLKNKWHKCRTCNCLCPPNEILCGTCKIIEREKMKKEIRQIFFDLPWTRYSEVQKKVTEKFPHMKSECTLATIDSERRSLILRTAARVKFGDVTSLNAKFLVMLEKQIDGDQLTEILIRKTLNELRFNLADQPKSKNKTRDLTP